jgi:hypothetical protein
MSPFFRFLVGHLVGDFVLQTIDLVRYKASSWKGLLLHTGILLGSTALCLWSDLAAWWPWLLLLTVFHFLTDWGKVVLTRVFPKPKLFLFFLDQGFHIGAILAAVCLCHGGWPYPSLAAAVGGASRQANRYLLYTVAFLVAFFVVPLLEVLFAQTLTRAMPADQGGGNSVRATVADRLWGGGERVAALGLFYIGGAAVWFSPLVFLPRILVLRPDREPPGTARGMWAKVATSVGCTVLLGAVLLLLEKRL